MNRNEKERVSMIEARDKYIRDAQIEECAQFLEKEMGKESPWPDRLRTLIVKEKRNDAKRNC